jgi:purine-binding chemotaxis protein CheW
MKQADERRDSKSEIVQLIGFYVGAEEYGLEILRVKEIIRIKEITRLPKSPEFVKGIINLRGDVIPIIDLGEKFGLEKKDYSQMTRVIVVEIEGQMVGMVVDSVSQVLRISSDQIEPPPMMIGGLSREYVHGVGKVGDRLVILLNIDLILSADEQLELGRTEEVQESPPEELPSATP